MLAYDVKQHLKGIAPRAICDACLATAIGVKVTSALRTITGAFGLTNDFTRQPGTCPDCGIQALVTRAGGTE